MRHEGAVERAKFLDSRLYHKFSHKREVKSTRRKCQLCRSWHCGFLCPGLIWSNIHCKRKTSWPPGPTCTQHRSGSPRSRWAASQPLVLNGPNSSNRPWLFSPSDQDDSLKFSFESVIERTKSCCYLFHCHQGFRPQLKPKPKVSLGGVSLGTWKINRSWFLHLFTNFDHSPKSPASPTYLVYSPQGNRASAKASERAGQFYPKVLS